MSLTSVEIIRDYLEDTAINISVEDLENDSNEKMNSVLSKFYVDLRKKKPENNIRNLHLFQSDMGCRDIFRNAKVLIS